MVNLHSFTLPLEFCHVLGGKNATFEQFIKKECLTMICSSLLVNFYDLNLKRKLQPSMSLPCFLCCCWISHHNATFFLSFFTDVGCYHCYHHNLPRLTMIQLKIPSTLVTMRNLFLYLMFSYFSYTVQSRTMSCMLDGVTHLMENSVFAMTTIFGGTFPSSRYT